MSAQATLVPALLCAWPAFADGGELYPAADCAALWFGYGDYAAVSSFLDGQQAAYDKANAFRAAAIRLTGDAEAVEAHIARWRPDMALMMEAYIGHADRSSREIFERLSDTCKDFARTQPETRLLQ